MTTITRSNKLNVLVNLYILPYNADICGLNRFLADVQPARIIKCHNEIRNLVRNYEISRQASNCQTETHISLYFRAQQ